MDPIGFTPGPKTKKELALEMACVPAAQLNIDSQTIIFILVIAIVLMAATMFVHSMRNAVM